MALLNRRLLKIRRSAFYGTPGIDLFSSERMSQSDKRINYIETKTCVRTNQSAV